MKKKKKMKHKNKNENENEIGYTRGPLHMLWRVDIGVPQATKAASSRGGGALLGIVLH